MKRMVESGKTLLVDGPASISLVSGKVDVFGSTLEDKRRVVVREGKRLPFAVEKTALFEISAGEDANLVEVDGHTIPFSWINAFEDLSTFQDRPFTIMVIGIADSGKTSLCTFLTNKFLTEGKKVAILDGDPGQSDVGPPGNLSYAFVTNPITDLFNLRARNAFFVGFTSPSRAIGKIIEGLVTLKEEISSGYPDIVIINTDGWVEGEDAVDYKFQLVEKFQPHIILFMRQKDELASLLNALRKSRKIVIDSPSLIKHRSRERRRSLRELGYIKYLKGSKVRSIPLSWLKIEENNLLGLSNNRRSIKQENRIHRLLGVKPLHVAEFSDKICIVISEKGWIKPDKIKRVEEITKKKITVVHKGEEEGLLMALYDAGKKFLGIALLREIDYIRAVMKIYTPVSQEIATVKLGGLRLDDKFKETPLLIDENG